MAVQRPVIGIIGCGNISDIYLKNLTGVFSKLVDLKACSDLVTERMEAKAKQYGIQAMTTKELLADKSIDMVLNLSTPLQHFKLNSLCLNAGKHVYCEKPLAVNLKDGKATMALAKRKKLRVGCAPDTFLGGGIQQCRKLIDDGAIGTPVSAMAFMTCHGHESWHPDPEFYYQKGGGPMLDMGPYYLTALVNLLGPVKRISASAGKALKNRTITSAKKFGKKIRVETPTHLAGTMDFASGAIGTAVMSFDVWAANVPRIEIHGTEGSLSVPDPNTFGGPIMMFTAKKKEWQEVPIKNFGFAENSRGIGITEMAVAIQNRKNHRVSGDLALHVLEAMLAFEESSKAGKAVRLTTTCKKPAAFKPGKRNTKLQ